MEDLHKLAKTCRYWRELTLATPTLWATVSTDNRGDSLVFSHSTVPSMPNNPLLPLVVHVGRRKVSSKMQDILLSNASRIRELHCMAPVTRNFLSFLQSFDASTLEHCLLTTGRHSDSLKRNDARFSTFFSRDAPRLRSLCLKNITFLPANTFPSLSRIVIRMVANDRYPVNWGPQDLVKVFSGCPRLEEAYIGEISWHPEEISSPIPSALAPLSLPRLRYFSLAYSAKTTPSASLVVEHLLSCVIIPPSCHLYFKACGSASDANIAILESIRHRIPGRDTVSHACLWITERSFERSIQLVFPEGSLRLVFPVSPLSSGYDSEDMLRFLRSSQPLFAETRELRVHYSENDLLCKLEPSLPTIFPKITALSLIPFSISQYFSRARLAVSLESLGKASHAESHASWPALDALWVSLRDKGDEVQLEKALATRAAPGRALRHLSVCYDSKKMQSKGSGGGKGSKVLGFVAPLKEHVEEITLMELPWHEPGKEDEWMVSLPERYGLPSAFSRNWPSWYQ